ncbi:MAG TPA: efflux RND transporter permease subunit [Planctomycetes bacterium]|nr:efflux RND transporter permease subunit [Planctomycetaceae bacterium]HIM31254.1 efflux RND transporter permease subunit [Planctomycetota bacterium]
MNIAEVTIQKKTITLVCTVLVFVGGLISYARLPRLEDPEFTIKSAVIITPYPGATPQEVEEEVTDLIEQATQQLGQLKEIKSKSERGLSTVTVDIKDKFDKRALPQVWDELRRKIGDVQSHLPPGAGPSLVNDDFGDVYGVYYAITGDGYSYAEIKKYADFLQRELLQVRDVKKVVFYATQPEAVYVQISRERLAQLGISLETIFRLLADKNLVVSAGSVEVGSEYIPIDPGSAYLSPEEMADLVINEAGSDTLIRLGDVATIERGYREPSRNRLRYSGNSAIGLAISTVLGGNVVTMGDAIQAKLEELDGLRPIGMELHVISMQSDSVKQAVKSFIVNLLEAVAIVVVTLLLFMGVRCGLLIGSVLFLTICATMIVMDVYQIALERISLGALIIALGMLVDNAIVVTEGMLIRIQKGEEPVETAKSVVSQNIMPLLGATVIAVLAFGAIGLSQDNTGEFCRSLFTVLLISLLLSWVTAITITPLFCVMFLKADDSAAETDPYAGRVFQLYRGLLLRCIRFRWATVGVAFGILGTAIFAFRYVDQSFFPASTRPQFIVDFWLPMGTHIDTTGKIAGKIEEHLRSKYPDDVSDVTSFVGQGGSRFLLTYNAEQPDSGYGQLLVDVNDYRIIDRMSGELQSWSEENLSDATVGVKKFALGPGGGGKIQLEISGRDPAVLFELTNQAMDVMNDANARTVRSDWRQRTKVVRPVLSDDRARATGITNSILATTIEMSFQGAMAGLYREGDLLLPIIARAPDSERADVDSIRDIQVYSPVARRTLPIQQVVAGFQTDWEYPIIRRIDRRRTVTIHCDQRTGNASTLLQKIMPTIEAIELPPGYSINWAGEYGDSLNAQAGLAASLPKFLLFMVLIVIFLFNALRQPLIIWLCVPLALIGVSYGLLLTGLPFGFMALLGALALTGMLIKNAIVLLDQIGLEIREGKSQFDAIVDSGVSRMRPVSMAALTTILGMIPLLLDPFFNALAITVMAGLACATVLTLIVVPVLYAIMFRVKCAS